MCIRDRHVERPAEAWENRSPAVRRRETEMAEGNENDKNKQQPETKSGTATKPKRAPRKTPAKKPPQPLPPWKVLLHNDDKNDVEFVVTTIVALTPLNQDAAAQRTLEAHHTGVA